MLDDLLLGDRAKPRELATRKSRKPFVHLRTLLMLSRGCHHLKNGRMYGAPILYHSWSSARSSNCAAEPSRRGSSREQQGTSTGNRDAHLFLDAAFWNGHSGIRHVRRRNVEVGRQSARCCAGQNRERAGSTCPLGEKTIMPLFLTTGFLIVEVCQWMSIHFSDLSAPIMRH
jgi:hypothetical protein